MRFCQLQLDLKRLVKGFTLIELTIVLALILTIATLSVPSLWFLKRRTVLSQAEKLHTIFCYMQQLAVSCNKNLLLKFGSSSYSYDNYEEKLPDGIEFGFKKGVKGPPSSPTIPINSGVSFVNSQVSFFANGKIQPGTVYLVDSAKNYLYAVTVPISQVSFIRKYRYSNGSWQLI